jgi:hypothetical protein
MTDPVSGAGVSAGIGMASSALSGILGASSASSSASATAGMYNYQASIAKQNAAIAKQNADYAMNQGEQSALKYGIGAGQRMGQITAAQGSSGFDLNSGSATNIRKSQAATTNMDLTQIRSDAAKTAYNYDVSATQSEEQASLYKMSADNASKAGGYNAAASILGSAASVSSEWLQWQNVSNKSNTTVS